MKGLPLIHRLTGVLLMAAVLVVYGIGTALVIKVEHHHHAGHDHHDHSDWDLIAHHHGDDSHHHPEEGPIDGRDDGEDGSSRSSHSHFVFLGVDAPVSPVGFGPEDLLPHISGEYEAAAEELCPDGPSFDLIKPPQLV